MAHRRTKHGFCPDVRQPSADISKPLNAMAFTARFADFQRCVYLNGYTATTRYLTLGARVPLSLTLVQDEWYCVESVYAVSMSKLMAYSFYDYTKSAICSIDLSSME